MKPQSLDDIYRTRRFPWWRLLLLALALVLGISLVVRSCKKSPEQAVPRTPAIAAEEDATPVPPAVATEPAPAAQPAAAPAEKITAAPAAAVKPAAPAPVPAVSSIAALLPQQAIPLPAAAKPIVVTNPLSQTEWDAMNAKKIEILQAQDLHAARKLLLQARTRATKEQLTQLEQELGAISTALYLSARPSPDKISYTIQPGDILSKIADRFVCPVSLIQKANKISDASKIRPGQKITLLDHPKFDLVISKGQNTLTLFLNGEFFKKYVVSTGANAKTPVGTYEITVKQEQPSWYAPDGREIPYGDPENILGTHWMEISATGLTEPVDGYGIHGTSDESSLGTQSSAGCIRMKNAEVLEIYTLIPYHTSVFIVE